MGDFIACGAATHKLLSAASSSHCEQRPSASVILESMVGASIYKKIKINPPVLEDYLQL